MYHTLNKMNVDVTSKVLVAEAWVPSIAKPEVQRALRESAENSSTQVIASALGGDGCCQCRNPHQFRSWQHPSLPDVGWISIFPDPHFPLPSVTR